MKGDKEMTNTALFNQMLNLYNTLSFTHNYIFGFTYGGNVYFTFAQSDILPVLLTLDKASRGQGYSLRFRPNKEQKQALLQNCEVLCSENFFNSEVANSRYNKGEIFEKMVTEYYGQYWEKDSVPFTEDGDLTINGIAYQLKFESATFTNEKTLWKILKNA